MTGRRLIVAAVCAGAISGPSAAAAAMCPGGTLTTSQAVPAAIQGIVGWEQSENLSPLTIRESRQAMEAEKPRELSCSGNVCTVVWRAWPVSVWCANGRTNVGIGGRGSPWATVPFGKVVAWNDLPG